MPYEVKNFRFWGDLYNGNIYIELKLDLVVTKLFHFYDKIGPKTPGVDLEKTFLGASMYDVTLL